MEALGRPHDVVFTQVQRRTGSMEALGRPHDIPLGSIKTHNAIIGIFSALENAKWKKYMMVGKPFLSA